MISITIDARKWIGTMASLSRALAAAGLFCLASMASGQSKDCEAYWSAGFANAIPQATGNGPSFGVFDLQAHDDGNGPAVFVAGQFHIAGSVQANGIAKWDGAQWSPLEGGMTTIEGYTGQVYDLEVFDEGTGEGPLLYAGGYFASAGTSHAYSLARWNGREWSGLGQIDGSVRALCVFDDGSGPALFIGGSFSTAGGVPVSNVAKWDGTQWSAVGRGIDQSGYGVWDLAAFDDGSGQGQRLIACGSFLTVDGVTVNHIAQWDGQSWSGVGGGVSGSEPWTGIWAVETYDSGSGWPHLYIGGKFTAAGGVSASNIARWTGSSWAPVGSGVTGFHEYVFSLDVVEDGLEDRAGLYVGGRFVEAGGQVSNGIARWNGVFWMPLGGGVTGSTPFASVGVWAIEPWTTPDGRESVLVAGRFTHAGGNPATGLAQWFGCPIETPPAFGTCRYAVAVLDAPDPCPGCSEGHQLFMEGLNNAGSLIGHYWPNMFQWDAGTYTLIPPPAGTTCTSAGINDAGSIIANSFSYATLTTRAFVRLRGQWSEIVSPGAGWHSYATAINNANTVTGYWHNGNHAHPRGFVWTNGQAIEIVSSLADRIEPHALNESGIVVGQYHPLGMPHHSRRAFEWSNGEFTDLGALLSDPQSTATSVNNRGHVVGYSGYYLQDRRAILFDHGRVIELGTLPGAKSSAASDINDRGEIVGSASDDHPEFPIERAFVWTNGVMHDLNDLVPTGGGIHLMGAVGINDAGLILALGVLESVGEFALVLLTPVDPVPADINADCRVDAEDLIILLYEWGDHHSPADLNGDGTVNVPDLLMMIESWG